MRPLFALLLVASACGSDDGPPPRRVELDTVIGASGFSEPLGIDVPEIALARSRSSRLARVMRCTGSVRSSPRTEWSELALRSRRRPNRRCGPATTPSRSARCRVCYFRRSGSARSHTSSRTGLWMDHYHVAMTGPPAPSSSSGEARPLLQSRSIPLPRLATRTENMRDQPGQPRKTVSRNSAWSLQVCEMVEVSRCAWTGCGPGCREFKPRRSPQSSGSLETVWSPAL